MEKEIIKKMNYNITNIISKSFPKLKNKRIVIRVRKTSKKKKFPMAAALFDIKGGYLIKVNLNIMILNNKVLTGLLAHELVHIENYTKKSLFRNIIWRIKDEFLCRLVFHLRIFSRWKKEYKKKHKKIDIEVVKRGYGSKLMEYERFLSRSLKPKQLKERHYSYLSEREIRKLMKKK